MQKNRETYGSDEVSATMPNAGALVEAQRAAAENATRIANAACHYALSVNRAWIDLWESRLDDYLELPKRFMNAQTEFMEQAFDHYQESIQKLGSLTTKASHDAQTAVRETQAAGERVARQFQSDAKETGWGNRPKENPMQGGAEHRRDGEQQPGAH